jgi:hypothetical protein
MKESQFRMQAFYKSLHRRKLAVLAIMNPGRGQIGIGIGMGIGIGIPESLNPFVPTSPGAMDK